MSDFDMITSRLRAQLDQDDGMKDLDKVVERHGRVEGEPFSFDGHEFQREIIRDTSSRISVRKCSQVGLTELMVQKTMALCSVMKHKRVIFTLPVAAMAQKMSKDRFDGLIEQSEFYRGMVVKANNSASLKKVGSCSLYIGGTFGDTGAISVPAEVVISDEIDFSNQEVLGKLSSRLRHATKDERGYSGKRFEFSTPTVDDYGIDLRFKRGHQSHFMVKCKSCSSWELPDFFEDFVIPGMDKPLVELERKDVHDDRYRVQDTWIKCPNCGTDLWSSIMDPSRREWVARHPDRWEHSYQVMPWDVPIHNTPSSIVNQFGEYVTFQDFANFVLGIPFTSPDNSFLTSLEHRDRVSTAELWIYGQCIVKSATVGGLDVGKTCHLVVMAQAGNKSYVVWAETITNTINKPATEAVINRFEFFKMRKLVVDAGPDITLVNNLVGAKALGSISACQYVRSVPGLDIISEHDDGQLIKADRTKTLNDVMTRHNAGDILYAKQLSEEIFSQLKSLKKIRNLDASGDAVERFEATGEDHYAHALGYANIARMAIEEFGGNMGFSMPPSVGKMRLGKNASKSDDAHRTPGLRRIG